MIETLIDQIAATAALPLERAQTLPAAVYTDPDWHAFERDALLPKEWLSVAHVSQVPHAGDFLRLDVLGEPMLVVRGKDGVVRVLSRVCRHRGMDLMPAGHGYADAGNERTLLCPYHYWSYDLNGKLKGAPEMQKAEGFDRSEVCLHEHRSEIFEGFVFVTQDREAPPVAEKLAGLRDRFIGRWGLGDAEVVYEKHWESAFDWKLLVENFMEPYHHMGSHRDTLQPIMPAHGCWTEPEDPDWVACHLPLSKKLQEEADRNGRLAGFTPFPGLEPDDHKQWWVFLGHPTFLLFVGPNEVFWYRLLPTGPGTCSLLTTLLVSGEAKQAEDYAASFAADTKLIVDVHLEDVEALEGMQRGAASVGCAPGRLSHLEEPIHHFQRWLARAAERAMSGQGVTVGATG
ncbi:aromatic ring-hydroxylating oxygenase subunit alpha [Phycisphaera mikurensis]|uniref:Putative oxidoreductase n=1 Tax=Phycisphaera mikurensis (strain NBRC 102666 / KCTC 22515 / FYK2301M01) TaxID=1142394 RepID=I0IDZ8_PHYMF|nr:aromatic ring-hydroxylating dioxygenase subunit alpha [Phycisphaera mikurensis]MBB6441293.1 phenylpropionate dioxygenase-like ring-hydroxylating dioxygenase large terminal subunit [Phycisphaera mikurensis]BAM03486.1 putative oxidoreductase [Phycisphaera mikurensis NBRC 102666]